MPDSFQHRQVLAPAIALVALAVPLAACGDDASTAATTTTTVTTAVSTTSPASTRAPTTTAPKGPISAQPSVEENAPYPCNGQVVDVKAWRDVRVRIALDNQTGTGGGRLPPRTAAWVTASPTVLGGGLVGTALEAPENGISGFGVVDLKAPGRNTVLLFAAKTIAAGQPCTAVQVVENSGTD